MKKISIKIQEIVPKRFFSKHPRSCFCSYTFLTTCRTAMVFLQIRVHNHSLNDSATATPLTIHREGERDRVRGMRVIWRSRERKREEIEERRREANPLNSNDRKIVFGKWAPDHGLGSGLGLGPDLLTNTNVSASLNSLNMLSWQISDCKIVPTKLQRE